MKLKSALWGLALVCASLANGGHAWGFGPAEPANRAFEGPRYAVSEAGLVTDLKTGLEWVVGPDQAFTHQQAEAWVSACPIAGGGFRMPFISELEELYQKGLGSRNLDPAFGMKNGWLVWSEHGLGGALYPAPWGYGARFDFRGGVTGWGDREGTGGGLCRAFGVRSPKD